MKECIEFNLTPFEQMMESANVELDDFGIDDVFQEGELFDKLSRKFQPVVDSLDFDPKFKWLQDEMDDPKRRTALQTIKLIIKTIIGVIAGFIRNIGYRRPSKLSKYGTVFVNRDELEYCNETRKQLKKITDNFEELVIGAVLRHESKNNLFWLYDPDNDKLSEIKRNRKVESILVSSSKQGKPMTIGELNTILDYTSDTIDSLIKKIDKGFDIRVEPVNPRADKNYDEDAVGECKVTINGKVVYEGPCLSGRNYTTRKYEQIISDYTSQIVDYINYLKDFQMKLINDVNSLKNIGDNKIDKNIDYYMK
jgi:hypothetical protein